jgi:hypothetical protein
MIDRTEAMDNLIAQDADLIKMTDDLVQRLRRTYRKEFAVTGSMFGDLSNRLRPFPILATEVLFNPDGRAAADLIQAQAAEIERLHRALLDVIECDPCAYEATIARAALELSK